GDADAQYNLGAMYVMGKGVTKNYAIAYAWRNLAIANCKPADYEEFKKARDALEEEMTPAQIEEGQRLSREWFEKYKKKD
ncbi:MAG: SEL1-like repeat protein, partial [Candidatus Micrarchaeota archaeon]|nr:SEL1-like repeat protein [Candidatus Micrarchaeota archaeon]